MYHTMDLTKMPDYFIGWDIGGAHLKYALVDQTGQTQTALQYYTPVWQGLEFLQATFQKISLPKTSIQHQITLTAELSDIFIDRQNGMMQIFKLLNHQFQQGYKVYAGSLGLLDQNIAPQHSHKIFSANWMATTDLVATHIKQGILLDIGSTTTDLVPFYHGCSQNLGCDDQSRLQHGELYYSGVIRTPLFALTDSINFKGISQGLMAEYFSTTADIYRITGDLYETDDLQQTADHRAKDLPSSIRRLARVLGTDPKLPKDEPDWLETASLFKEQHILNIMQAINKLLINHSELSQSTLTIVGAGMGCFLAKLIAQRLSCDYVEFAQLVNTDKILHHAVNTSATAVSVALLGYQS